MAMVPVLPQLSGDRQVRYSHRYIRLIEQSNNIVVPHAQGTASENSTPEPVAKPFDLPKKKNELNDSREPFKDRSNF